MCLISNTYNKQQQYRAILVARIVAFVVAPAALVVVRAVKVVETRVAVLVIRARTIERNRATGGAVRVNWTTVVALATPTAIAIRKQRAARA